VKVTRIARLILVCVVSLAVASTIGLTLLYNISPPIGTAASKDLLDAPKLIRSMVQRILPMGDPIDNPKPNNTHK
jgi:hypothetical protein